LIHELLTRVRFLLTHRRPTELDEELAFHIEQSTNANIAAGLPPQVARRKALIEFGGIERTREQSDRQRPGWFLSTLLQDIRYALRGFRRNPLFTTAVVVTLTLGIGANAAIFTLLNGTLLRNLPYRAAGNLMEIYPMNATGDRMESGLADIEQWQQQTHTLGSLAYYTGTPAYLLAGSSYQEVSQNSISSNLFDVLGITPVRGRGFTLAEQQGNSHVVILNDDIWRGNFHAASDILGKSVKIDDTTMTVVGVMPRGFAFPADQHVPQVWTPAQISAESRLRGYDALSFNVIARRRKGISLAAVSTELTAIQSRLIPLYADKMAPSIAPSQVQVENYRSTLSKNQRPALLALSAAVFVIWLIACANVANLMLARSTSRQRELAVRGALGASRWRLVQQLIVESLLLSCAGSILGIALAQTLLQLFHHTIITQITIPISLQPDIRVLSALLVLSVLSALAFGVAPAILASGMPLEASLRQGGAQAGTGHGQQRMQRILVMAEIGLSLAMLVACGLLLKTVFALRHVPLGFRTDHVYVLETHLPAYKYRTLDVNTLVYKPLLERVKGMHSVESAAITTLVPLDKGFNINLSLYLGAGTAKDSLNRTFTATAKATGPELQQVLGFRMVKGRYFNDGDTPDSQLVAVVNQAFARAYESGDKKTSINDFSLNFGTERKCKIVGIIDDFHQAGIAEAAVPEIDINAAQMKPADGFYQPMLQAHAELAIRATEDEKSFIPDLQRVMHELNPDLAATNIRTMNQVVEDAMGSNLLAAHLLEACGTLSLVVALMGLYSLLAYLVTLRRREFGLRMALGAQREQVLTLVLHQAGRLLAGGIILGLAISVATTRLLTHFLFGVKPQDIATIAAAALLIAVVGILAAWLPARKAAAIDPMEALRTE
jgi:predicted permease